MYITPKPLLAYLCLHCHLDIVSQIALHHAMLTRQITYLTALTSNACTSNTTGAHPQVTLHRMTANFDPLSAQMSTLHLAGSFEMAWQLVHVHWLRQIPSMYVTVQCM